MMLGQGRPNPLRSLCASARQTSSVVVVGLAVLTSSLVGAVATAADVAPAVRLRIAWGGGQSRLWGGTIRLDQGSVTGVQSLGIEADQPGSSWLIDGVAVHQSRSTSTFGGLDIELDAPRSATVELQLQATGQEPNAPVRVTIDELIRQDFNQTLDESGNRLSIRRTPGDQLRVNLDHDSLVFFPGEPWRAEITPWLLGLEAGSKLRVRLAVVASNTGQEVWTQSHDHVVGTEEEPGEPIVLDTHAPQREGVYELRIRAKQQGLRSRLTLQSEIAERVVQFVVLDRERPAEISEQPFGMVVDIDPTHPRWWERLTNIRWIPAPRRGPLNSDNSQPLQHELGMLVRLAPNSEMKQVSWEAYPLPIEKPGRPHILEIEYPNNVPQSMGISIVEPNAAGEVVPIGLDSGVIVPDEASNQPAAWARHRLVFWPKTESPLVLLTNQRDEKAAVYGKIRVLAGPQRLPAQSLSQVGASQERLWATYMDRPLFAENFSAPQKIDRWSGRCLDDWTTFYEGTRRMAEYLEYAGYNALVLTVSGEGSTLYPSQLLEPTPRHDTGVFFNTALDPIRKDVLELVASEFDRRALSLIPAIQFSAPLPAIEAVLRAGGPETTGLQLVGGDGRGYRAGHGNAGAWTPNYNPLDPRVQTAMLEVVSELVSRVGDHTSFKGLAIDLSADGFAQLPGPNWGLDDRTIARFAEETGLQPPGTGADRFARRAAFLAEHQATWLQWRAAILTDFYRRLRDEVCRANPDAQLLLCGTRLFDSTQLMAALRPALPRRLPPEQVLLAAGIDVEACHKIDGVVVLRPNLGGQNDSVEHRAAALSWNESAKVDRLFATAETPGSLFYHAPKQMRLGSFDAKSPFRNTYTWLVAQTSPSGWANRQRFAQAIAQSDSQLIADGGWLLPLGQEDALTSMATIFKQLPAEGFRDFPNTPQPVTLRYLTQDGQTYIYAVNDSPWSLTSNVTLNLSDNARAVDLATGGEIELERSGTESNWQLVLEPYELKAIRIGTGRASIIAAKLDIPEDIRLTLQRRIRGLANQAAALGKQPSLDILSNPSFEIPPQEDGTIEGWIASTTSPLKPPPKLTSIERGAHEGERVLLLESDREGLRLTSPAIVLPTSGRLSVSVWLRVDDPEQQPTMRLALVGKYRGQEYFRYAELGPRSGVAAITEAWSQFLFPVTDLPLDGLSDLRVQFELRGEGKVWIDDVELFDLWFTENERVELLKIVTTAGLRLENGQYADCLQLLEGYWPQFLDEHITLPEGATVQREPSPASNPREARNTPAGETKGFREKVYDLLPDSLRLF